MFAKTQNLWAFWSNAMPSLAHSTLGTSCSVACAPLLAILGTAASVHPWTSPVAFLNAKSSALIDAIPLKCFSKLRNFLLALGSTGLRTGGGQGTVLSCILSSRVYMNHDPFGDSPIPQHASKNRPHLHPVPSSS